MNPERFYEDIAQRYPEEMMMLSTPFGRELQDYIITELKSMHGTLADFGCGKGRFAIEYARMNPGNIVLGLDIAETNCKAAKMRSNLMGCMNTIFMRADITKPLRYSCVDNIICIETLEHLPDMGCAIDNIMNTVNPGGTVLITVPNKPHKIDGYLTPDETLACFGFSEPYFHSGYTYDELLRLFPPKKIEVIPALQVANKTVLKFRRV